MSRRSSQVAIAVLSACCGGCAESGQRFHSTSAPESSAPRAALAVLGVYEDGRLSQEAWASIGPRLSRALHEPACDIFFGEKLEDGNPDFFVTFERAARDVGLIDELIDKIAFATTSETIISFWVFGRFRVHGRGQAEDQRTRIVHAGGPTEPYRFRGRPTADDRVIEFAATFFSVPRHRTVAELVTDHSAASLDEAAEKFTAKLSATMPDATCAAWNWNALTPHAPAVRYRELTTAWLR